MDKRAQILTEIAFQNDLVQQRLASIAKLDSSQPTGSLLEQAIEKALASSHADESLVVVALKVLKILEEQLAGLMARQPARGAFGRVLHGFLKFITGR